MTDTKDKCPFCGAGVDHDYPRVYECGTEVETKYRDSDCYEDEISQLQARHNGVMDVLVEMAPTMPRDVKLHDIEGWLLSWDDYIGGFRGVWPEKESLEYLETPAELLGDLVTERDELKARIAQLEGLVERVGEKLGLYVNDLWCEPENLCWEDCLEAARESGKEAWGILRDYAAKETPNDEWDGNVEATEHDEDQPPEPDQQESTNG